MKEFCHRCGGELPSGSGESPFCPHCGSPQLFLSLDYQSVETGGEGVPGNPGVASTGATPPPRPQQVDWKMAILCSAAVAGVAGALSVVATRVEFVSPISTLWVVSGSLITLGLYQRRRPAAWMDAGVGARIGLVVGLCLIVGLAVPTAAAGLVARYGLHAMGGFDAEMADRTQKAIQQSASPIPAEMVVFLNSAEFRGGIMLAGFCFFSVFLMVLSMLGGAFAGMLRMRRKAAV